MTLDKAPVVVGDVSIVLPEPAEYYEGGRAFISGEARRDCPYTIAERGSRRRDPDPERAAAWFAGWDTAWRAQMQERSERFAAAPRLPWLQMPTN